LDLPLLNILDPRIQLGVPFSIYGCHAVCFVIRRGNYLNRIVTLKIGKQLACLLRGELVDFLADVFDGGAHDR